MEGCHKNGVNTDNRSENLRWGTKSSNAMDAVRHGTAGCLKRFGVKCHLTRLSPETIDSIRKFNDDGWDQTFNAKLHGCHQSNVSYIVNGKSRKRG